MRVSRDVTSGCWAGVAAYLLSPVDLIPDAIPIIGQVDDLSIAVLGLRHLLRAAGPRVVEDLWRVPTTGWRCC